MPQLIDYPTKLKYLTCCVSTTMYPTFTFDNTITFVFFYDHENALVPRFKKNK